MKLAVVGHTEWIDFLRVEAVPRPGEIVHARRAWQEPGGGGAVAAVQCLKLAGDATFYTAVGAGELGERTLASLRAMGIRVEATVRPVAHRRAVTFVDAQGERTIAVLGDRLGPAGADALAWEDLAAVDGVYFTAGDRAALAHARRARVLVATPRAMDTLRGAGVRLDALVGSALDPSEAYRPGDLDPEPLLLVQTMGAAGGTYRRAGEELRRFPAATVPGPVADAYGAGDSFAAGLTAGLAAGSSVEEALDLAARCGAACLTGSGPYAGQLDVREATR